MTSAAEDFLCESPAEAPDRLAQLHRSETLLVGHTSVSPACQQRPHHLHMATHSCPMKGGVVALQQERQAYRYALG